MDEERKADLSKGIEAAQSILHRANDALDKEDRIAAVTELQGRVDDWKGHKVDHFGELLLYGNYTVLKGEGAREVEREVSCSFLLYPTVMSQYPTSKLAMAWPRFIMNGVKHSCEGSDPCEQFIFFPIPKTSQWQRTTVAASSHVS